MSKLRNVAARTSLTALFAAIGLSASPNAAADPVTVRDHLSGPPPSVFLAGTNGDLIAGLNGGAFELFHTGTFELDIDRGSGFNLLLTYCTEPDEGVGFDTNPPDPVGAPYNTEPLVNKPLLAIEAVQLQTLWFNAFAASMTDPLQAAAFQTFVWEVCGDDVFDVLAGDFRLDPADPFSANAGLLATGWYANITGGIWTGQTPLEHLESPVSQDLLAVIPEPASATLLAAAAVLLARPRRRGV